MGVSGVSNNPDPYQSNSTSQQQENSIQQLLEEYLAHPSNQSFNALEGTLSALENNPNATATQKSDAASMLQSLQKWSDQGQNITMIEGELSQPNLPPGQKAELEAQLQSAVAQQQIEQMAMESTAGQMSNAPS